jgi:hypothetical protein
MAKIDFSPPEEVTLTEVKIRVEDIEHVLRSPDLPILEVPYEPRLLTLKDGRKMVIRRATFDDVPVMLETLKPVMDVSKDFYDIVGVRTYGEILGWYRRRVKDHIALVGVIDGELAAIANYRLWNEKLAISLHTITFKRGAGIGAAMYLAKMEDAFDVRHVDEWWATYESYTGFRYWGIKLGQMQKPYPEVQHELGGSRVFYNTRDQWERWVRDFALERIGTRPVPQELLESSLKIRKPEKIEL